MSEAPGRIDWVNEDEIDKLMQLFSTLKLPHFLGIMKLWEAKD